MKIHTSLIALFLTFNLTAQQEPVYSQYWNNYMNSNPAMTGANYKHAASVLWKDSWVEEYSWLPRQTTLTANYAMRLDSIRSGVGLSYRYDAWGYSRTQTCMASFAHHIPLGDMILSMGVSAGITKYEFNGAIFMTTTGPQSPRISNNPQFTTDVGLALRHEKWNVGLSVTQLYPAKFEAENVGFVYELAPHAWLFADYTFDLGSNWKLTPRTQLTADENYITDNFGVTATTLNGNLWFGVQSRNLFLKNSNKWICPVIGYDFYGKYRIGYAMNISTDSNPYEHNHIYHEVNLSFLLK